MGKIFTSALIFAWQDIKDNYRRSALGPFWITASLGIQLAAISIVFSEAFGVNVRSYVPFLAISLVLWNFMVGTLNDSSSAFPQSEAILKHMEISPYFPLFRSFLKNLIIACHNSVVVAVVLLMPGSPEPLSWFPLIILPGFALLAGTLFGLSGLIAMVGARFRDFPPMISSSLMIAFYVTPVLWMPDSLSEGPRSLILHLNPLYYLMDLVRSPLLGHFPLVTSWLVGSFLLLSSLALSILLIQKRAWKIAYWL